MPFRGPLRPLGQPAYREGLRRRPVLIRIHRLRSAPAPRPPSRRSIRPARPVPVRAGHFFGQAVVQSSLKKSNLPNRNRDDVVSELRKPFRDRRYAGGTALCIPNQSDERSRPCCSSPVSCCSRLPHMPPAAHSWSMTSRSANRATAKSNPGCRPQPITTSLPSPHLPVSSNSASRSNSVANCNGRATTEPGAPAARSGPRPISSRSRTIRSGSAFPAARAGI